MGGMVDWTRMRKRSWSVDSMGGDVRIELLWWQDREAEGLPTDASALQEMTMAPAFPFIKNVEPPFCPNCTAMLGDVNSTKGKLSTSWEKLP